MANGHWAFLRVGFLGSGRPLPLMPVAAKIVFDWIAPTSLSLAFELRGFRAQASASGSRA